MIIHKRNIYKFLTGGLVALTLSMSITPTATTFARNNNIEKNTRT